MARSVFALSRMDQTKSGLKSEGRSWRLVQVSGLISMAQTASGGEARGRIASLHKTLFRCFPSCSDCLFSFGEYTDNTQPHECSIKCLADLGIPFSRSADACPCGAEIKNRSGEG